MNISEISQLCGVSTTTVSRVLNDNPHVKDETRARILSSMEKYGYTPNAFARGLGLNTMKMVGIMCTEIDDAYYAKAVSLVEASLREHGFNSLLYCTGSKLPDKKSALNMLLEKRVDAVILVGSAFREEKDNSHLQAAAKQVPVVIINGLVSISGVYCVLCNEKEAMSQNVQRLAAQGCRGILYVYDTLTYSGSQKLEGYRNGLMQCGLEERTVTTEKDVASACAAVEEALRKWPDTDAVLASEDLLAIGAQKAASGIGRVMPLIGFNNSRFAQCATPELTSVDNMLGTLCSTATELMLDLLDGKEMPQNIVVSAKLVERETYKTQE